MFGVSFRGYDSSWHMPLKGLALLGQAVGVCNRRMEDSRYNELCQKIQKAAPNFQFASRCTASAQPVLH